MYEDLRSVDDNTRSSRIVIAEHELNRSRGDLQVAAVVGWRFANPIECACPVTPTQEIAARDGRFE